ncbi:MAG: site-specific integrase [Clostridia bacterium]|nr:site-specific integrase [Clostridia bacterium]
MARIEKRGDSYRIIVYAGYDSYGKQIRRTKTWKPDKQYTPKQLEKALNKAAVEFEEKVLSGNYSTGGNLKLIDYIPQFLESSKLNLAPTTVEEYNRVIQRYIIPSLGHLQLKNIRPAHVQEFVNNLASGRYRADGKQTPPKPATVKRYYAVLQSILSTAYRQELITKNPTDSGKIKLPSIVGSQKTDILSKEQIADMLSALDSEPLQFQVLVHLAINTGCRRGELVALKWSDIDFDNDTVNVTKSLYQLKGEKAKTKTTKNKKERLVSIPAYCTSLLRKLKVQQADRRFRLGTAWRGEPDNYVFTKSDGSVMHPNTPTESFNDFLLRHNLPHIKFHALRHTSATLLLLNGANIKQVASRLGHSQLSTTNRYVHAIQEADRVAADSLGDTLISLKEKRA